MKILEKLKQRSSSANKLSKLRVGISLYEMIGGLLGFVLTVNLLRNTELNNSFFTGLLILAMLMYLLIFVSGLLLLRNSKWGNYLSLFVQAVQIPQIYFAGILYQFVAGSQLSFGFLSFQSQTVAQYYIYLGSTFNFSVQLQGESPLMFVVNFVPIVVIYLLSRLHKEKSAN